MRLLRTEFVERWEERASEVAADPTPVLAELAEAVAAGNREDLLVVGGQSAGLIEHIEPAADIVARARRRDASRARGGRPVRALGTRTARLDPVRGTCEARIVPPDVASAWPALPYESWSATCDTLHAHTQILGKLAVALAPPEPQLQHAALRLTARGWETAPLPAPDGSGTLVVALDLRQHAAVVEHSDGRAQTIPLTPDRAVADVTRDVLAAAGDSP